MYFELRRSLGPEVPSGDLLRIVHLILRSYYDPPEENDDFPDPRTKPGIETVEVDIAITMGWRVWEFEAYRERDICEVDVVSSSQFNEHLARYLGPGWKYKESLNESSANLYRPVDKSKGEHSRKISMKTRSAMMPNGDYDTIYVNSLEVTAKSNG
jgi:hypothetical protein